MRIMIVKNKILCFLTLFILIPTNNVSGQSVEYYEELLEAFLANVSQWEQPTDSRRFFSLCNETAKPIDHGQYDFIIVGAGVAGSVLANRLTESGKCKVLVLEAGQYENDFTDVPGFATYLVNSDFNWGYKTIPQKTSCLGMKNQQCNYPRGKAVGGSSVINFMIYVRGNKEDFERWGHRNPGWDYKSVLPYFRKTENSILDFEDPGYHGHGGPVSVETARYRPSITKIFLESAQQRGREILDYNGRDQSGYSRFQIMTKNGTRCSASKAYIQPAKNRPNLEILDHILGTKILIRDKKAYGVEFTRNCRKYRATASKEVIVSGGVVNSPQILMLSGIGPRDQLERLGIPVVEDLPVGEDFHDHVIFPALLFSTNITNEPELSTGEYISQYLNGHGLLTVVISLTAVGFESPKMILSNPRSEYAFLSAYTDQAAPFYLNFMQVTQQNYDAITQPLAGKYFWSIIPVLLHPRSTGTIKLKTRDPLDYPLLDSNLYSARYGDDMKEMLKIIKDIFDISRTPAFRSINSTYVSEPLPACTDYKFLSDDYWMCALKQLSYPVLHGVSTCKMGPKDDRTAVVDNKLKVYGIKGLRVADASVIPFPLSCHPTPAVYMVGEKASDLIRQEHGDL
ncbi:hypothetical protein ILUMI_02834 [Ignelater luminosus]|uniref:Glucose-methanol-choline oxidoreductase N-terminal domain-containing protein n=1 Tax=Ignelater luminosus TaxID=2038154 RepID=A0A8K0DC28_IGNLU|nr:hypothetical protein ILUMI_02834 [Ignelater luminosus]